MDGFMDCQRERERAKEFSMICVRQIGVPALPAVRCSKVDVYTHTHTQVHKHTNARMHKCTNAQMHKCTNA